MPPLIISGAISFVANLLIGLFVYFKNPRSRLNAFFALFSLMVSGWSVGSFLENVIPDRRLALAVLRTNYLFAVWLPAFYIHFVYSFSTITPLRRQVLRIAYAVSAVLTTVLYTPLFIRDLRVLQSQPYQFLISSPGPIYYVFFAYFGVATCEVLRATLREAKLNSGHRRLQFRYLTIANAIAIAAGFEYFFRVFGLLKSPPWDDYILVVYLLLLAYAMVRHQLMDIGIAVTRTGILIGVYALVLLIPAALATVFRPSLTAVLGPRWWLVPQGVFATLALAGPFVYLFFQRRAEAKILSEQRRYQATLMNAARGMVSIRDLKRLLRLIAYLLTRAMKLAHAEIFIWDSKTTQYIQPAYHLKGKKEPPVAALPLDNPIIKWLQTRRAAVVTEELSAATDGELRQETLQQLRRLKASVIVPSSINERLIGFVVLGQKRNGRMFSQDDLNVLQTLASQAALAIENARFFEELQSTQAQLFQSEKMAALGRMGAGMSHQLHNRFQALLKNSGDLLHIELPKMLKQPDWRPEQRQQLEKFVGSLEGIEREAGKGAEIVRKLVKYARLSPGDQLVDLHDVITEAIGMLQFTAKLETIDLVYDLPASLPKIRGNATFLQDIFFNLTDNGWQAIETKHQELASGRLPAQDGYKGVIAITAKHLVAERKIKITVHDNGIGMTKEQLARLFEPFFSTKSSVGHGTGLGLFIVKKMVEEAHQGTIEAASTYGVGTSFILHFPAVGP